MKINKTEILSFDEWFNTYENLQCDKDSCEDAFEAGQQSKQDEIDELQKNFNNALKTIGIQQQFLDDTDGANKIITSQVDELQNRIDDALKELEYIHFYKTQNSDNAIKILKGEETK